MSFQYPNPLEHGCAYFKDQVPCQGTNKNPYEYELRALALHTLRYTNMNPPTDDAARCGKPSNNSRD